MTTSSQEPLWEVAFAQRGSGSRSTNRSVSMLKIIGAVILVLIAGVLIFAATKPDTFQVQRSASIKAPLERIFPFINDFHRWTAWSPWESPPELSARPRMPSASLCG